MELPLGWYIYIIPGSLLLLSAFLIFTPSKDRDKILSNIRENAFIALPMMIIFSFLIGLSANIIIVYLIRPILIAACFFKSESSVSLQQHLKIDQDTNPVLLQTYKSSYEGMVFTRLLWSSSLILAFVIILNIIKPQSKKINKILEIIRSKTMLILLILLIVFSLFWQWWHNDRPSFIDVEKSITSPFKVRVGDSLWNDSSKKDSIPTLQHPYQK